MIDFLNFFYLCAVITLMNDGYTSLLKECFVHCVTSPDEAQLGETLTEPCLNKGFLS